MTEPVIEAADIVKILGDGAGQVQALKRVSLALAGGQLTLLMGPSGSGKTTLLSILGCMLSPTSGMVRVGGKSTEGAGPEDLAKLRREHVGFIFQSYHLFPTLTATDNVRLALDVRGENSSRAVAKSQDALAMVGLAHKTHSFPRELSGGEIAKDPSRGVLVVTHDPRILPFADRVVRIEDGRIVGEARGGGKLSKGSQDSGGIYDYAET
jgi:putative ABC transport system ATP-binding protein